MNILIHACLQRNDYVYRHLIPSMLAQGIREDEIHVWMDFGREGALHSTLNSFKAVGLLPGGTWHIGDDVVISRDFAEQLRAHDDGIVCGFANADFDAGMPPGIQPPSKSWYSFQCIRIPNAIAAEFVQWFWLTATKIPGQYQDLIKANKYDDWFWREFLQKNHEHDLTVLNLAPNVVDHIDYLIGGSVITNTRPKLQYRSAYWEDESIVEELKEKLNK
ncbi:MAG: hypothetical protein II553_07185 [Lachnospiraceae bacterium]|nr:hypothetical protein [Lachnospiraceae bacterium]